MTTRLCLGGAPILALLALAAAPAEARAARVLSISITVDGQERLRAAGGDNGESPAVAVWQRLTSTELKPPEGAEPVPADVLDPLRATVRGNIVIDVSYAGKAQVTEVHLVRRTPSSAWTVDPADVERIGRQIGLVTGPPIAGPDGPAGNAANPGAGEGAAQGLPLWVWAGGAIAAALFVVGLVVRLNVNPSPPARLTIPREIPGLDMPPPDDTANDYPDAPPADH
jgi:hypothetical protein